MNVLVLSTYDIAPVRDGGQTRYFNIYRHVAARHDVTILAYDFRRDDDRAYVLADRLTVLAPPCDGEDRRRFDALGKRIGRHLHDVLCVRQHRFSPQFLAALRREAARADIVVASHPYLAPVAFGLCRDRAVKIYESHNVEYDAKRSYFADDPDRALAMLLDDTWQAERLAAVEADYVTTVSDADAERLCELYRVPRRKITTVPNGVDTTLYPPLREADRVALRQALGAGERPLAVFLGSDHPPNRESYQRTRVLLAESGFDGFVVLVGSIGERPLPAASVLPFEEIRIGFVDEALRAAVLGSADFALQLVFAGSGTNLKLFDYMAAGCLVVANAFGRRGIPFEGWYWPVESTEELAPFIRQVLWRGRKARQTAARARQLAVEHYDWRGIAAGYVRLLTVGRGGEAGSLLSAAAPAAPLDRAAE